MMHRLLSWNFKTCAIIYEFYLKCLYLDSYFPVYSLVLLPTQSACCRSCFLCLSALHFLLPSIDQFFWTACCRWCWTMCSCCGLDVQGAEHLASNEKFPLIHLRLFSNVIYGGSRLPHSLVEVLFWSLRNLFKMDNNLIGLVNRIQRACTAFADYGGEGAVASLWESLPSVAVVGGQVCTALLSFDIPIARAHINVLMLNIWWVVSRQGFCRAGNLTRSSATLLCA